MKEKAKALMAYLASLSGISNVKPLLVTIDSQTFPACRYARTLTYTQDMQCVQDGRHKAGETYTEESIYCIGPLPNCYQGGKRRKYPKGKACFPFEGIDWYIAAYMPLQNLSPQFAPSHPFGENFILCPWSIPGEAIDKYEAKPYSRFPLSMETA